MAYWYRHWFHADYKSAEKLNVIWHRINACNENWLIQKSWNCYRFHFPHIWHSPQGSYYQLFSFSHSFPLCQLFRLFLQHTTCFTFYLSCFLSDSVIGPLDTRFVSGVFVYFQTNPSAFHSVSYRLSYFSLSAANRF